MNDVSRLATVTEPPLVHAGLKTPRAAAVAGIVFSILMICSLWLLGLELPVDPRKVGVWLQTSTERVSLALNLIPFAGIAFLWFLGVLRDRLGAMEDRFFATVFLGSGLLFLGMIFVAASAMGGLILAYSADIRTMPDASAFIFGRAFARDVMRIYAFKMVAVFMITTSTLVLRTGIATRWIAFLGYASAIFIMIASNYIGWAMFVFPIWVLVVSIHILFDNLRRPPHPATDNSRPAKPEICQ